MRNIKKISIVLPAYNEEGNISLMAESVVAMCAKYTKDYQIIFVDDGSQDDTLAEIIKAAQIDSRIKYVSFTRNFGHDTAIRAGIDHADGDFVIVMDSDLQHPIETAMRMIRLWEEGYDIVHGARERSGGVTDFCAASFYKIFNYASDTKLHQNATDFMLLDKKVYEFVRDISETEFFFRGMVSWVGLKHATVTFSAPPRMHGKTKYSFATLITLAVDAITSFSTLPLRLLSRIGFFIMLFSFVYALFAVTRRLFFDVPFGFTAIFVSVLFLGGINIFALGIIGEYIGKILMETKKRPKYLVKDKNL